MKKIKIYYFENSRDCRSNNSRTRFRLWSRNFRNPYLSIHKRSHTMNTSSKIFGTLMLAIGIFAAGCALLVPDAEHQWYLAALCWVVAFALLIDASEKLSAQKKSFR